MIIGLTYDSFDTKLPFGFKNILFGFLQEPPDSKINFIILIAKGYIWKTKFKNTELTLNAFQRYFKSKLEDLKHSYDYMEKTRLFDQWNAIYDYLSL